MDAIARWDAAVSAVMAQRGLSKAAATREVAITDRRLHAEYLAAYQQQHSTGGRGNSANRSPAAVQSHAPHERYAVADEPGPAASQEFADPIGEWNSAIANLMARGMARPAANRQLVISNTALHQQYIAAYTARWGEAVRHPNSKRRQRD